MKHNARNAVLAGLLAASMAFSTVPVTAFAAPTSKRDVADSTVTINGLKAGDTVTAYQIADADIDANNSLTWKMTNGLPEAYDTIAELSQVASDGYSFTNVSTAAQTAAGAIAASSAVTGATNKATATVAEGKTSADLTLGSGYYLVRVTNGQGNNDTVYQNMLVDLTPKAAENGVDYAAHDAVSANAKKENVSLDKKSKNPDETTFEKTEVNTWKVGDSVPFQITTAVPSYPAGATNAVFNVKDAPDQGLKIDTKSVVVKLGETTVDASNYTIEGGNDDGAAMTIKFKETWTKANPGASVTITYSAALTENAKVTKTGEVIDYTNNKATVEYSPDTNTKTTTETGYKTVDVHTYGVELQKLKSVKNEDGTTGTAALAGAGFTLYKKSGEDWVEVTPATGTSQLTSDENGYVYVDGLAAGDYKLVESKVPAGYQKVSDIEFTLSDESAKADNPATDKVTEANFYQIDGDADTEGIQGVVDPDQGVLPTTGEAGTFAVTAAGVVLVAGGITLVMGARKRSQE